MKRYLALLLALIMMVSFFTGCGKNKNKNLQLYKDINIKNYVEVSDYMGIEVNTASSTFKQYYDAVYEDDLLQNNLYDVYYSGTVLEGDNVNLDYEGKIDGVAFKGGTEKNKELTVGLEDALEQKLIGLSVGETKDVTVTLPIPYPSNPEVAGKEAVFTCKINYIRRFYTPEQAYIRMGFSSSDAYKKDVTKRAINDYIRAVVTQNANIKDYPEKEYALIANATIDYYAMKLAEDNMSLETVLAYNEMTIEDFKKDATIETMNTNMALYYILVEEELKVTDDTLNSQEAGIPAVIAEIRAVESTVLNHLYNNAIIK